MPGVRATVRTDVGVVFALRSASTLLFGVDFRYCDKSIRYRSSSKRSLDLSQLLKSQNGCSRKNLAMNLLKRITDVDALDLFLASFHFLQCAIVSIFKENMGHFRK